MQFNGRLKHIPLVCPKLACNECHTGKKPSSNAMTCKVGMSGKRSFGQRFLFHHFSDNRTKSSRLAPLGQMRSCKWSQTMTRDRASWSWWRFDSTVTKNWPSRWLLQIDVVFRKIILRKRIYTFDATGDRNDKTTKLPFEMKKWSLTNRNRSWLMVPSTS